MKRAPLNAAPLLLLGFAAGGWLLSSVAAETPETDSEEPGFAVVELFTSEGCSSCPPADRLLAEIDRWASQSDAAVYALSFHVDYWNRLGWTDPYSSPAISRRQREYAAAAGTDRVYTPQMIVNGAVEFVGSDGRRAERALAAALDEEPSSTLSVESADEVVSVTIAYEAENPPEGAVINVAVVQPRGKQEVPRGENAGRTLDHVNIVRAFRSTPLDATGVGELRVEKPSGFVGPYRVVAYLQESETKRVVAAASTQPAS